MPRRWRWRSADRLFLLAALWLACALAGVARAADGAVDLPVQRLVLVASLNGVAAPEPVLVRRQGPVVWMRAADLRALGVPVTGAADVMLNRVPGLSVAIDDGAQAITLALASRAVQRVRINDPPAGEALPVTPNGWGAAINYDVTATRGAGRTVAAGLIDAVVFAPRGYVFASAAVTSARGHFTRLDSGYTIGDPRSTRRLTLGDVIGGATEQSRPVRLGGVQWQTDFDLRPDLITYPVPMLTGSAAVPSAVDLLVNGQRRAAGEVRAGQFAVADVPLQTGVNTITVAVRDALGRETRQTVTTYATRALLKPGLSAWSVEAGLVRTGYATTRDHYRGAVASGSLRRGLSDRVTAEVHGEASARVGVASAGATVGLGAAGLFSASAGTGARGGAQWSAGYERIGRPVSVSAHYTRTSGRWRDLAADGGAATRAHQLALTLGFDLGRLGSLGVTAVDVGQGRVDRPRWEAGQRRYALAPSSLITGTYSVRVARRLNLVANAGIDRRRRGTGFVSIGALMTWGSRTSGYAGALARAGGASATAEWTRAATQPGEWGYRASVAAGGIDRVAGDIAYQGGAGYYTAQLERTNGRVAARLGARGAVVIGGGSVLLADRLSGSFAVVDTAGQAGVAVFRDHHRIGVTNRHGKLIVANLRAWEVTGISLDPLLLDDELQVDAVERRVRLAARAGVPVRFALSRLRAARVRLVQAGGAAIAAGSRVTVNGGVAQPVGMDGEVYATELRATNRLRVALIGGGACTATVAAPARVPPGARIGPVVCVTETVVAVR